MENQQTVAQWSEETFGETGSNIRVAARANEEMAELLRVLSKDDADLVRAAEEAADIVIVLYRLAKRMGFDLHWEIDQKMQINRTRKWSIDEGIGRHVSWKHTEKSPLE